MTGGMKKEMPGTSHLTATGGGEVAVDGAAASTLAAASAVEGAAAGGTAVTPMEDVSAPEDRESCVGSNIFSFLVFM
jgi:hypothetical protein